MLIRGIAVSALQTKGDAAFLFLCIALNDRGVVESRLKWERRTNKYRKKRTAACTAGNGEHPASDVGERCAWEKSHT